ncbi:MAG TPA: hypothetical protein VI299_27265 [Polyangiales bacterium]
MKWVTLVLSLWLCAGCTSGTRIYVRSSERSNDGNTLYAMVRSVDAKTIGSNEIYHDVAGKLFADPVDATVVESRPIFPGNPITFNVSEGSAKNLVLYFLFTNPGQNWRLPLRAPLPAEVYVDLGNNEIDRVQMRK